MFPLICDGGNLSSSALTRLLSIATHGNHTKTEDSTCFPPASLKELEDDALMTRLQSGELAALEVLYDRYFGLLLGVSTRLLRDAAEAEDLVQEIFLYLFRRNQIFDSSKGSVRSWLVQVTYSRAFNRYKHLKSHFFYQQENCEDKCPNLPDPSIFDPEKLTELSCWRAHLLKAFQELSEEQRFTLKMFFFEGYTLLEISEKVGQSLGNVRHYYYRGLERLRHRLSSKGSPIPRD